MAIFTRLVATVVTSATAASVVIPLTVIAPAAADPCSVSSAGPSTRSTAPSVTVPTLPKFPVLHLPIGRMPSILQGRTSPNADPAKTTADGVAPNTLAAPAPKTSAASNVGWITGPNTSSYSRFRISGADLGIMWDNGQSGSNNQVLIAFGDTFGDCSVPDQEWRKNTLFRSADRNLADGMTIPDPQFNNIYAGSPVDPNRPLPNFSRQVIASLNLAATEVTVIPTAGIAVGTTQYVNFMSVSNWGSPGQWSTNFSAVAVSTDNGENWIVPRSSIRPAWFNSVPNVPFVWGYQNFQMGAYVRANGYVYAYGTTPGRGGAPFLSRVAENSVADLSAYEYYTPFGWLRSMPFLAIQVVWTPGSEMTVAWNDYLNKFVMLYTDTLSNVVMRTADKPEGPWSKPATIVASTAVPGGIYAPYIHPWSSGRDLYFTLSLWSNYSVMLMRATLG
jgi:D-arabinan endo alpha-(1,5)-arabinofuranosidase